MQNSSCSCPSDLWQCDPSHGCVCPQGADCGIEEEEGHEVVINYLRTEEEAGAGEASRAGMAVRSGPMFLSDRMRNW